jgi:formylglycine-generating enzyme required for sulfatase activity
MTRYVVLMLVFTLHLYAEVPSPAVNIAFVKVSNENNPPHPVNGYGSVSYEYYISKYEITAGQWCSFLNCVAKSSTSPYYNYLYTSAMSDISNSAGIQRVGNDGNYQYLTSDSPDKPINNISWISSALFCNWLSNGQGTNSILSGAYDFSNFSGWPSSNIIKNQNSNYRIPTADEWFKAAYYDPTHAQNNGYWNYATRSDTVPNNDALGTNNANYTSNGVSINNKTGYPISQNRLLTVGFYNQSPSYYGTYDQNGNVNEWLDTLANRDSRYFWGGAYDYGESELGANYFLPSDRSRYGSSGASSSLGLRIVATQVSTNQILNLIIESSGDLKTWTPKQIIPIMPSNQSEFFRFKLSQ